MCSSMQRMLLSKTNHLSFILIRVLCNQTNNVSFWNRNAFTLSGNKYAVFKNIRNPPYFQIYRTLKFSGALHHGEYEYEDPKSPEDVVNLIYINREGKEIAIKGKVGDNAMYLAHRYNIEVEGACEGSLACCTCHVYVDDKFIDCLPDPVEEEEDMLDLAPLLKENSRLGCQIVLSKDLDGIVLKLPQVTRNFYVDGHVPTPH